VILGGLYWKKGTAQGAWTALIVGGVLSLTGILGRQYYGPAFFLNGLQISFFCSLISLSLYVGISLLTWKEDFNLDRMLHRGIYAAIQREVGDKIQKPARRKIGWGAIIGIDENFTLGDKWIAGLLFAWSSLFTLIMIFGTLWNLISPWPIAVWSTFWHYQAIVIPVTFAVVVGVWFTWGGLLDSVDLFRRLRHERVNPLDNGAVMDHQNLDESVVPDAVSPVGKD
jgi:SSS family solute:Na+ symporter